MNLSKQAFSAMVAVSVASAAFSVTAMTESVSDFFITNDPVSEYIFSTETVTEDSSLSSPQNSVDHSDDAIITQTFQKTDTSSEETPDAVFLTEPVEYDGISGLAVTGFDISKNNNISQITLPAEMDGLPILALKNTNLNANSCMTGAASITSLDLSQAIYLKEIDGNCFVNHSHLSTLILPTDETSSYLIGNGSFSGCTALSGSIDLSRCTSVGAYAFSSCTQLQPIISTNTASVDNNSFDNIPYVTIEAPDETTLAFYCNSIHQTSSCPGLLSVKKVASIPGVADNIPTGLSYNPSDIPLDTASTYYLSVLPDNNFSVQEYHSEASYICTLKAIPNGQTVPLTVSANLKFTFTLSSDLYDPGKIYRLSVDGNLSNPLSFTSIDGGYSFTYTLPVEGDQTIVALLSQPVPQSVSMTGKTNIIFGDDNNQQAFTALVTPSDANQTVSFSSSNPEVLSFDDPNVNLATIHKVGTATVEVKTLQNGRDGTAVGASLDVVVNPGLTPTATAEGYKGVYDGTPHGITLLNLLEGSTVEYSTDNLNYSEEYPTSADVCSQTVYYEVSNPNDTDVYRSKETVQITPASLPIPPAPECSGSSLNAITLRQITNINTEQGDPVIVLYGIQTPGSDNISWQTSPTFTGLENESVYNFYIQYRVDPSKSQNYINQGSAISPPSTFIVGEDHAMINSDDNGTTWKDEKGDDITNGYGIPFQFKSTLQEVYQVEINWGSMNFHYNYGVWNPETLTYDNVDAIGWGNSFDGIQNQISIINRSTQPIDVTITLDQNTTIDPGFQLQLVKNNAVKDDITNPSISGLTSKLVSGNQGNSSTTAYINLTNEDDKPNGDYDNQIIGELTVTIKNSAP